VGRAATQDVRRRGNSDGHAQRFRDNVRQWIFFCAGVPLERVAIMLGHSSVRITEKHYSPWIRERQEQAEADVRRSWARDPLVLMEDAAISEKASRYNSGTAQSARPSTK